MLMLRRACGIDFGSKNSHFPARRDFSPLWGFGDLWHGRDASNASIPALLVVLVATAGGVFSFSKPRDNAGLSQKHRFIIHPAIPERNGLRWNRSGRECFTQG
jgi:hypothetical protein